MLNILVNLFPIFDYLHFHHHDDLTKLIQIFLNIQLEYLMEIFLSMRFRISPSVMLLTAIVPCSATSHAQCHYRVTVLPTVDCGIIGLDGGTPAALNDYGQVAGWHSHCLAYGDSPFAWTGGPGIGTIPLPAGVLSARAAGISGVLGSNGIGQVVGQAELSGIGYRVFLWQNAQWTTLPILAGATIADAFAISADGSLIVGMCYNNVTGVPFEAAFWRNGKVSALNLPLGPAAEALAVDATGTTIVGWMGDSPAINSHAFLWRNGQVTDLGIPPAALAGAARSINGKGQIVVVANTDHNQPPGFFTKSYRWENGRWTDLGMLSNYNVSVPTALNDRGEIVGFCDAIGVPGTGLGGGWIWRNGTLTELATLILPGSGIHGRIGWARAINQDGQIATTGDMGTSPDLFNVTVLLTPVPDREGDTNCDGRVDIDDLLHVINDWGPCGQTFCSADLDQNGLVNIMDLIAVLDNWDFPPRR